MGRIVSNKTLFQYQMPYLSDTNNTIILKRNINSNRVQMWFISNWLFCVMLVGSLPEHWQMSTFLYFSINCRVMWWDCQGYGGHNSVWSHGMMRIYCCQIQTMIRVDHYSPVQCTWRWITWNRIWLAILIDV